MGKCSSFYLLPYINSLVQKEGMLVKKGWEGIKPINYVQGKLIYQADAHIWGEATTLKIVVVAVLVVVYSSRAGR